MLIGVLILARLLLRLLRALLGHGGRCMLTSRPLVQTGTVKASTATAAAAETSSSASTSATTGTGPTTATIAGHALTRPASFVAGFTSFCAAGIHGLFLIRRNQSRHFAARLLMNLSNFQNSLLLRESRVIANT